MTEKVELAVNHLDERLLTVVENIVVNLDVEGLVGVEEEAFAVVERTTDNGGGSVFEVGVVEKLEVEPCFFSVVLATILELDSLQTHPSTAHLGLDIAKGINPLIIKLVDKHVAAPFVAIFGIAPDLDVPGEVPDGSPHV